MYDTIFDSIPCRLTLVTFSHVKGDPVRRNTEIGLFYVRKLEKLYVVWRASENKDIVTHGDFVI